MIILKFLFLTFSLLMFCHSFSSLTSSSIVMISFCIISKTLILKRKGLSDGNICIVYKEKNKILRYI